MSNTMNSRGLNPRLKTALTSPAVVCITLSLVVAIIAAIDKGSYVIINAVVTGGMWALMAMGLALVFGVMNITSFVHGEFFMIGGLVAYFVFAPFVDFILEHPTGLSAALLPSAASHRCVIGRRTGRGDLRVSCVSAIAAPQS